MSEANRRYGKLITDSNYIRDVIRVIQDEIDVQKESDEYNETGMKCIVMDRLDDLEIYPDDIDYVFSELEF